MTPEDENDLAKKQAHIEHILTLSALYRDLRGRKAAHNTLKEAITLLEIEIATELKEYLNG